MIKKIISGGQSGADIGGIKGTKMYNFIHNGNIEVGGTMPKRFKTEYGNKPNYAKHYNMVEDSSNNYTPRTIKNIEDSDGTIIIFDKFTGGSYKTMEYCIQKDKPFFKININESKEIGTLLKWLNYCNIETLNVAGNRESKKPGIQDFTIAFIIKLLYHHHKQK